MGYSTRDLQARLAALGFSPGAIDGMMGRNTRAAEAEAKRVLGKERTSDLFHSSGLHRVHWHWTAGSSGVSHLERTHYHYIIDRDGSVVEGLHPPEANADTQGQYAAHTLNANSGAIGVSIDAMAGARERPLEWGSAPILEEQVEALARLTAELCERYWIPISRYSTLSHAEVEPTLGIAQKAKWDITVLPGMTEVGDPVEVGDKLRKAVRRYMDSPKEEERPTRDDKLERIAALTDAFAASVRSIIEEE